MGPGTLVVPDNIIDYSWGRKHTFLMARSGRWCMSTSAIPMTMPAQQGDRRRQCHRQTGGESGRYACTKARGWKPQRKSSGWSGMVPILSA
jgi:5'-methylthioadenosine phosphorylase